MDEAWLEWSEVSKTLERPSLAAANNALHLYLPSFPLASTVVKTVELPIDCGDDIRIHPLLYEFLMRVQKSWTNPGEEDEIIAAETSSPVKIGPLPIEPQYLFDLGESDQKSWVASVVSIVQLPSGGGEVFISFIFLDRDLCAYKTKVSEDVFTFTIQNSLLGRLIKKDSVMLLSCRHGFAIVQVSKIIWTSGATHQTLSEMEDAVYQIPFSSTEWQLHSEITEEDGTHSVTPPLTGDDDSVWESSIPGYEVLHDRIFELTSSIYPSSVAPTGLLLTGVPGVGKSRLASFLAHSYTIQRRQSDHGNPSSSEGSSSNGTVFYLSVRDLIFQAVSESDLYQNIIVPGLRSCSLWILDDLHLLERDDSGEEVSRIDAEYISVCNALLQAIDGYHESCFILGIGQVAAKLPPGFTKSGRLEKQMEMLPPTQSQRNAIWDHLLVNDVPIQTTRHSWCNSLATNTAGCVAADLVRVHQDSWTRFLARNPQEENSSTFEWEDLREATRYCVPSQLSELDITKSRVFESDMSWKEIHLESWKKFGGYEKLKRDIFRQVVVPWKQFLRRSEDPGASADDSSWIDPPAGVLFHGVSGCGKTEAAKCLATSLELSMIQVRASDILDKWLGGSEALLRSLFSRARSAAPCILFIDEIDSIACNRAEDDTNDSSSRILSTLLNEMDGVSSEVRKSKILVMACTNRLQALDAALLRPGRLQEHFEVLSPNVQDMSDILHLYLTKIPLGDDVVVEQLAASLVAKKATGAEVEGLCREVCFSAFRKADNADDLVVSGEEFHEAISMIN
jgi:SpoVK/Ycf46/Vps4 family AAA+-type ATPase